MRFLFCGKGIVGDSCLEILKTRCSPIVSPLIQGENFDKFVLEVSPDIIFSVHWPFIFSVGHVDILNLHNSYLPWNRGADSCAWAIVNQSFHGATMHWVDQGIDTGPIFYQERIEILTEDTTDSLYKRTIELEKKVFSISIDMFLRGDRPSIPQDSSINSFHKKSDFNRLLRAVNTSEYSVVKK